MTELYEGQPSSGSSDLALPLPSKRSTINEDLILIIVTYLSYSFQVLIHLSKGGSSLQASTNRLFEAINRNEDGFLLSWALVSPSEQVSKQLYPLCASVLKAVETNTSIIPAKVCSSVRFYAVRCALSVSSNADVSWVWKLLQNISVSYIKSTEGDFKKFSHLHSDLVACITIIESKKESSSDLFRHPSFENFQRQWKTLALKANDSSAAEYISNLLVTIPGDAPMHSTSGLVDVLSKSAVEMQHHLGLQSCELNSLTFCYTDIPLQRMPLRTLLALLLGR